MKAGNNGTGGRRRGHGGRCTAAVRRSVLHGGRIAHSAGRGPVCPGRGHGFRGRTFTELHALYGKKRDRSGAGRHTTKKPLRLFTVRALISWSLCPELNWRPHPYQGCALPTELQRHLSRVALVAVDEEAFSFIPLRRQVFFQYFFRRGTAPVRCCGQTPQTPSLEAGSRSRPQAVPTLRSGAFRCAKSGGKPV